MPRKHIKTKGGYYGKPNYGCIIAKEDRLPVGEEFHMDYFAELFKVKDYVENVIGYTSNNLVQRPDGSWGGYIATENDIVVLYDNLGQKHLELLPDVATFEDAWMADVDDIPVCYALERKCLEATARLKEMTGETMFALHGPFQWVREWAVSQADYGSDYMFEWQWAGRTWDQGWYHDYGTKHWRLYINTLMPKDEIWIGNDR